MAGKTSTVKSVFWFPGTESGGSQLPKIPAIWRTSDNIFWFPQTPALLHTYCKSKTNTKKLSINVQRRNF